MVYGSAGSRNSVFPAFSITPEARYKTQWLPGTISAQPGFDAITVEDRFSLRNVLDAAEVVSYPEWSRQLAEILYLKRTDGNREELTKADREALILWMSENPESDLTNALLETKHPVLFTNPFPDERILITRYLGSKLGNHPKAYDLGFAVGRIVGIGSSDIVGISSSEQSQHIEAALRYAKQMNYYAGLYVGLGIVASAGYPQTLSTRSILPT